jgi:hypothetical protein
LIKPKPMYKIIFLDAEKTYKIMDSINFPALVNLKLNLERTGNHILCIINSNCQSIYKGDFFDTHSDQIGHIFAQA